MYVPYKQKSFYYLQKKSFKLLASCTLNTTGVPAIIIILELWSHRISSMPAQKAPVVNSIR